jgi:hypothetical protein
MTGDDLKMILRDLRISAADFAQLAGVPLGEVALWLAGEGAIPASAADYARLVVGLPRHLQEVEFARLKARRRAMRDGMYGLSFEYNGDFGMGVLILDNGRAYGSDMGQVRYDGDYAVNESSGLTDLKLTITYPAGVPAIFGVTHPYEWSTDATTSLDPALLTGSLTVETSLGRPLAAHYRFLRALPAAA